MTNQTYPLILHCEAMRQGESTLNRHDILVAADVTSLTQLDEKISHLLKQAGFNYLYSGEVLPANRYFEQHPKTMGQAMYLCGQLTKEQPIAFTPLSIISSVDEAQTRLDFVTITSLDTPKNNDQAHMDFWDQQWINSALKEQLFAQSHFVLDSDATIRSTPGPVPTADDSLIEPQKRTYLLIKADQYIEQRGFFDLDLINDMPVMCMYTGEAAENLKYVAPYLIDMTLSEKAYMHNDSVPSLHKWFFEKMWGNSNGVFIKTHASMDVVHQHFRKFLKLPMANGTNNFFHFCDPRVIGPHLESLKPMRKLCEKFFTLPGKYGAVQFIYEDTSRPTAQMDAKELPIKTLIADINPQAFTENLSLNEPNSTLSEHLEVCFTKHVKQKFCKKTKVWLVEHYGDAHFKRKNTSIEDFLYHQLGSLKTKFNIKLEYETSYALAGCYLLDCDIANVPSQLLYYLYQFEVSPAQRAENFLTAVQEALEVELQPKKNDSQGRQDKEL